MVMLIATLDGQQAPLDAAYVNARLTEAGACLLALPATGTRPAQIKAAWPEIEPTMHNLFTDTASQQRMQVPSAIAIDDMDQVYFEWFPLMGPNAVKTRRLLWLRSFVNPRNGRHIWPWRRLEADGGFGLGYEWLRTWHANGVDRIVTRLNNPRWRPTAASELP